MKQLRGFKFRIYPNSSQRLQLAQTFGCSRFVFNWGLNLRITAYKESQKFVTYNDTAKQLTQLKNKTKGSNRRQLAVQKIAKVHAKIYDCRRDFLHQLTTRGRFVRRRCYATAMRPERR